MNETSTKLPHEIGAVGTESDEWHAKPGTMHHCGTCGTDYPLYGACACPPAIPMPGSVGPTTYQVTVNGIAHPEMVTLDAYTAMQAERDALQRCIGVVQQEKDGIEAERDVLRGQLTMRAGGVVKQETEIVTLRDVQNAYKHERDAATARAERAERQRDHARSAATGIFQGVSALYTGYDLPDVFTAYEPADDLWLP